MENQTLKEIKALLEMLVKQTKDPNELLTIKQVQSETGFGINMVQKMFRDPQLNAQRYTTPFKVTRKEFYRYINENHDYLSERK